MWITPVSSYDKPCDVCGENVTDKARDFCLGFPELKGFPLICSKCTFKALTGKDSEWYWEGAGGAE